MKTSAVYAALVGLILGAGAAQLALAGPPPPPTPPPTCPGSANPATECVPGAILYFVGRQNFDRGFNGYSTSILAGEISDNLGGPGGGFIDDDYLYGHNYQALNGKNWNVTGVNAAYLGNNPGEIGLTKYGSTIGVQGYAALAFLAGFEFQYGGRDSASSSSVVVDGVTITGTYSQISKELNEAIYQIGAHGTVAGLDATALALVAHVEATFGSLAAAEAELKNDKDIWFLNGGSGKPELILQYTAPEGGSSLAYLLLGALACMGAVVFSRKQRPGGVNLA